MFQIIDSGRLGHAEDPRNNRRYLVTYTKLDENWPGTSSNVTFAVARETNGQVDAAYGFFSEQECYDFLTGVGPMEYHSFGRGGEKTSEVRERLGLPDGMVKKYQADVTPKRQEQSDFFDFEIPEQVSGNEQNTNAVRAQADASGGTKESDNKP